MTHEDKIWSLCIVVLVGVSLAVAFHYVLGGYQNLGYPYSTFLFKPWDAGNDFHNIFRTVVAGDPYGSAVSVYFPFTYLPLYLLRPFPSIAAFALLVAAFTTVLFRRVWNCLHPLPRAPRSLSTFILTVLTYPYLFCVDRGNLEMLVFLFLIGFLTFLRMDRGYAAALSLAAAAAMKGYPALFGLIFLARRQIKPFLIMIFGTIGLTVVAAWTFPGGILGSLHALHENLQTFGRTYIDGVAGTHFNPLGIQHNGSYFAMARALELAGLLPEFAVSAFEAMYVVFAAAAGLGVAWWVIFKDRALWRQTTLITVAVLVLPQISFDYKLILLMIPVPMFLSKESASRLDRTLVIVFGLLLIPKSYIWLAADITVSVILTPLLLTILAGLVIADGLTSRTEAE